MSTLLEQASLVLIPSGYKEDVVYSQIPTSGAGDLSFTRASNGTRVNSAGLVEVCPWNLLTYSEEFNNAAWTKDASTISSNAINAPNGTLTADLLIPSTTSATDHRIRQSLPNSVGNFNYSVYVKSGGYNWVKLRSEANWANVNLSNGAIGFTSGVTPTVEILSDGWYRISFSVVNVSGGFAYVYPMNVNENSIDPSAWAGNGTSGVYLWGAQLNIGSTAKPYFPTTDRLNVPRLTYQNGGGGCPSLLLEPQRTNLFTYSEQLDNAAWSKNNLTITANNTISLDGTQDADKVTLNSGTAGKSLIQSLIQSGSYSLTAFIKYDSHQFIQFFLENDGGPCANFDIQNGTLGSFTNCTSKITNFGNGWYRCEMNYATTVSTGINIRFIDSSSASRGASSSSTGSTFIWGAQLELGAYPTTYIPTTNASATRVADSFARNNIYTNGLITSSGGTWFVELRNNVAYTRDSASGLEIANAGFTQRIIIFNAGGSSRLIVFLTTAGAVFTTTTDTVKLAIKWNGSNASVFANGTKVANNVTFTGLSMENLIGGQGVPFFISQMDLFPTPLTDAECIALTTI